MVMVMVVVAIGGAHTTQKECDENIIDWLVVCVTQHCRGESRVSSSMSCNDNDNHREEVDGSAEVKKVVAEVVKVTVTVKLWFPPSVAVVVVAEVEVVDVILRMVWISMTRMMTWTTTMNKMSRTGRVIVRLCFAIHLLLLKMRMRVVILIIIILAILMCININSSAAMIPIIHSLIKVLLKWWRSRKQTTILACHNIIKEAKEEDTTSIINSSNNTITTHNNNDMNNTTTTIRVVLWWIVGIHHHHTMNIIII
mmetsp:Transcript_21843/g.24994  ORF Transcript_21843/g.24994 Transcript_21843/m.24994 type:complete len:254 (-) Transcript_21843:530-1291(-)